MPTLTVQLAGSSVVTGSKAYTLSDADVQKLINWAVERFTPLGQPAITPAQALQAWAKYIIVDHTGLQVKQRETNLAAATVPNLTFT
jgi:hypothetical protein